VFEELLKDQPSDKSEFKKDFDDLQKNAEEQNNKLSELLKARPKKPTEESSSQEQQNEKVDLENTRRLTVNPTSKNAVLVSNRQDMLPYSVAREVDALQTTLNDLYREEAKFGDGSSAFLVMLEQFAGGVKKAPVALTSKIEKDKKTGKLEFKEFLHRDKCDGYIKSFTTTLRELNPQIENELQNNPQTQGVIPRIREEITKMEEAIKWADDFKGGFISEEDIEESLRCYDWVKKHTDQFSLLFVENKRREIDKIRKEVEDKNKELSEKQEQPKGNNT
jgi:hypothetical protein